jgi:GNAT superfamily N-acetyltransferase
VATGRVERGIDPAWLGRLAEVDPIPHVFAIWDREHAPESVEFHTLFRDGARVAYLLIWRGRPGVPVVHWIGSALEPEPLLEALPPRPLIASVPETVGPEVLRRRSPGTLSSVLLMACDRPLHPDLLAPGRGHRLARADAPLLRELATRHPGDLTTPYAVADPDVEPIFGVVEGGRLVAVARIQASTPRAWMIGGVFTVPEERGRGYGREATRAAVIAAVSAGARPALFVKEENAPARRVYERLGFVARERRAFIDASGPVDVPNVS